MKTLYKGKWVELRERNGIEYVHNSWCNGIGVAILAFKKDVNGQMFYLGRYENNGAHETTEPELCSITGGYDNSDKFSLEECVLNELEEEGGYKAKVSDLIKLGIVMPSKASDTVINLFAIDFNLANPLKVPATGDGTEGEKGAYCNWITEKEAVNCIDPLVATMIARLKIKRSWN